MEYLVTARMVVGGFEAKGLVDHAIGAAIR